MPLEIAYSDVLQVGKNLSKGATIAIVAGAIGAAVGIIFAAGGYSSGDGGGGGGGGAGGSGINPETGEPY